MRRSERRRHLSEHVVQLVPDVVVLGGGDARVAGHQRVLAADVERVVHLPVDVPHLPRRVEQTLATRGDGEAVSGA